MKILGHVWYAAMAAVLLGTALAIARRWVEGIVDRRLQENGVWMEIQELKRRTRTGPMQPPQWKGRF